MPTVKVAVLGSRTITNKKFVFEQLDFYLSRLLDEYEVIIVHGGAKGVDCIANDWATERGLNTIIFEPDYSKYLPKIAPIKRNQEIVNEADYLIAITTGSNGTASTIKMAQKKGIPIKIIIV